MQVQCEHCGEELIGAVNRCWRCGRTAPIRKSRSKPPIRRPPVVLDAEASVVSSVEESRLQRVSDKWASLSQVLVSFAPMASIVAGGLGCLVGIVSPWSIVPAMIGISFGVLGMRGERRDLAATGLVMSVLALFLGFMQIGLDIKTRMESQQMLESFEEQEF